MPWAVLARLHSWRWLRGFFDSDDDVHLFTFAQGMVDVDNAGQFWKVHEVLLRCSYAVLHTILMG